MKFPLPRTYPVPDVATTNMLKITIRKERLINSPAIKYKSRVKVQIK